MAVDFDLTELDGDRSDHEVEAALEDPVRQHERQDRRIAAFYLGPIACKGRGGELVGDDLAILEDFVAGNMIVVPVTDHDADRGYTHGF